MSDEAAEWGTTVSTSWDDVPAVVSSTAAAGAPKRAPRPAPEMSEEDADKALAKIEAAATKEKKAFNAVQHKQNQLMTKSKELRAEMSIYRDALDKISPLIDVLKFQKSSILPPKEQNNKQRGDRNDFSSLEDLEAAISAKQYELEHSNMSLRDEKAAVAELNRLKKLTSTVKPKAHLANAQALSNVDHGQLKVINEELKVLQDFRSAQFASLEPLRAQDTTLQAQITTCKEEFERAKNSVDEQFSKAKTIFTSYPAKRSAFFDKMKAVDSSLKQPGKVGDVSAPAALQVPAAPYASALCTNTAASFKFTPVDKSDAAPAADGGKKPAAAAVGSSSRAAPKRQVDSDGWELAPSRTPGAAPEVAQPEPEPVPAPAPQKNAQPEKKLSKKQQKEAAAKAAAEAQAKAEAEKARAAAEAEKAKAAAAAKEKAAAEKKKEPKAAKAAATKAAPKQKKQEAPKPPAKAGKAKKEKSERSEPVKIKQADNSSVIFAVVAVLGAAVAYFLLTAR